MIRFGQWFLVSCAVVCLIGLIGCGQASTGPQTSPVKGTLTIDGQPANDVSITLNPVDSTSPSASGVVKDGNFELRTGREGKMGAVPGKYKVTLAAVMSADASAAAYKMGAKGPPKAEIKFPQKYLSASTSDKEVEIKAGSNDLKVEIAK